MATTATTSQPNLRLFDDLSSIRSPPRSLRCAFSPETPGPAILRIAQTKLLATVRSQLWPCNPFLLVIRDPIRFPVHSEPQHRECDHSRLASKRSAVCSGAGMPPLSTLGFGRVLNHLMRNLPYLHSAATPIRQPDCLWFVSRAYGIAQRRGLCRDRSS